MDISISTNLIAISSLQNLKFKTFLFTFYQSYWPLSLNFMLWSFTFATIL